MALCLSYFLFQSNIASGATHKRSRTRLAMLAEARTNILLVHRITKVYKGIHGMITEHIQMEIITQLEHIVRCPPTVGICSPDWCEMAGTHDAAHRDNGRLSRTVGVCPRDTIKITPGLGAIEKRCEPFDVRKMGVALPPSLARLLQVGREGEDDPDLCNTAVCDRMRQASCGFTRHDVP